MLSLRSEGPGRHHPSATNGEQGLAVALAARLQDGERGPEHDEDEADGLFRLMA